MTAGCKRLLRALAWWLWCLLALAWMHRGALAPSLRYCIVAEGNISQAVYDILNGGWTGLVRVVASDMHYWGRVRPAHWLFHTGSFLLATLRNGDFFGTEFGVSLAKRLNGDLQAHGVYLLLTLGAALACLSLVLTRSGVPWWVTLVFAPLVAASPALKENLLVNFCDSGEIGQVFALSAYLVLVLPVLRGEPLTRRAGAGACLALLCAYAMKETTIVALPVVLGLLFLGWLGPARRDAGWRRAALVQALAHVVLGCVLLAMIWQARSGAYVSQHYEASSDALARVSLAWNMVQRGVPVLKVCAAALLMIVASRVLGQRSAQVAEPGLARWVVFLLFFGLGAGFWAVNIPWDAPLIKYYLPSHIFFSAAALVALTLAGVELARTDVRWLRFAWMGALLFFLAREVIAMRVHVANYYQRAYAALPVVPAIATDIARSMAGAADRRVLIVSDPEFRDGALAWLRRLNRVYRVNIGEDGQNLPNLQVPERSFFRAWRGRPRVMVHHSPGLRDVDACDLVYLVEPPGRHRWREDLMRRGFEAEDFSVGKVGGLVVAKYIRVPPAPGAAVEQPP